VRPPDAPPPGRDRADSTTAGGAARPGEDTTPRYPDIPPERLAAPTLGAYRRAHGMTGWSIEGRHLFALAVAEEARRRALLERFDFVCEFLCTGGTVDQATELLLAIIDDLGVVAGVAAT
jgi:hypothetical protein